MEKIEKWKKMVRWRVRNLNLKDHESDGVRTHDHKHGQTAPFAQFWFSLVWYLFVDKTSYIWKFIHGPKKYEAYGVQTHDLKH
jgi:hypothetical protein